MIISSIVGVVAIIGLSLMGAGAAGSVLGGLGIGAAVAFVHFLVLLRRIEQTPMP